MTVLSKGGKGFLRRECRGEVSRVVGFDRYHCKDDPILDVVLIPSVLSPRVPYFSNWT